MATLVSSLPFMGRDDREAIRVGKCRETPTIERVRDFPTLAAAPPVPPHEGEGGIQ